MLSVESDPVRREVGEFFPFGNGTDFSSQSLRVYETKHGELFDPIFIIMNLDVMVTSPVGMCSEDEC